MPAKKKEEEVTLDKYFFTQEYDLSEEETEQLVMMLVSPAFRSFEKYLARKQNKKARAMVSTDDVERMKELRAQIKALGEITYDMRQLWENKNLEIDKKKTSTAKP